ncbi:hypothetical protein DJICPGNB_08610 [Escherichia coli]|nr:hypothetical protein DJICPGNB_08610 [Escherichia coli]
MAGVSSQALLKEDLFLVGTQDCPGQSVDVNAIAQMNLFLPSDYSAIRLRVDEAFSLRRLYGEKSLMKVDIFLHLPSDYSGMGVAVLLRSAAR